MEIKSDLTAAAAIAHPKQGALVRGLTHGGIVLLDSDDTYPVLKLASHRHQTKLLSCNKQSTIRLLALWTHLVCYCFVCAPFHQHASLAATCARPEA